MNINSNLFSNNPHFAQKGLIFDSNITFHNKNLLIGKNGAGKTRFLKALKEYYEEDKPVDSVVTLFFPEIHDNKEQSISTSLYDAIYSKESLNFQDFLRLTANDCIALIEDIYAGMNLRAARAVQRMKKDFDQLNERFLTFFDSELCPRDENSNICIIKHTDNAERKMKIDDALAEFSPGELMLFYLCIFLFYLDHLSSDSIILIIDEPEIHLHPKALIALMEMLTESSAVSQLWVASHSLFIMPLFPFEQIVHFSQNHICPLNRNTYKKIYDELIGLENVDIYELLKSVENWSYYQFIVENFFLPISKSSNKKDDEQVQKLLAYLESARGQRQIKVLDYGAGKFRLWECLKQIIPEPKKRHDLLQYDAFEPYPSSTCPEEIICYNDGATIKRNHYDVVVLMNVLHEIDPCDWLNTFHEISDMLSDNGVMVFLEVHTLTNGEQPYGQAGYLLLQDPQVKKLFPQSSTVQNKSNNQDKSNCWIVPKSDLLNVTVNDIHIAISSLEAYCEESLKNLDDERIKLAHMANPADVPEIKLTGRQYAFLSQQYINAHFANNRLNNPLKKNKNSMTTPNPSNKPVFPGIEIKGREKTSK